MTTTDIVATSPATSAADDVRALRDNDVALVSTFAPEQKLETLMAITNSTPLKEHVNKNVLIANVVAQQVTITDEKSGEVSDAIRTVIVNPDGKSYHATSRGVYTSLRNILAVAKDPSTWPGPLEVTVLERGTAPRAYLTLEIIGFKTK